MGEETKMVAEAKEVSGADDSVFEVVDDKPQDQAPKADPIIDGFKEIVKEQTRRVDDSVKRTEDLGRQIAGGFETLGQTMQGILTKNAQQPQMSDEEFEAMVNKDVFEKPMKTIRGLINREQGPILATLASNQMKMGKRILKAELQSEEKGIFDKYVKEIDAEFARIPVQESFADPAGAYEKAFALVKANHINEIVEERVNARAKQGETKSQKASEVEAKPFGVVEQGGIPPADRQGASDKISITSRQKANILRWMESNNVQEQYFSSIVKRLKEEGQLESFR